MIKNIIKKVIPSKLKRVVRLAMHSGEKYNCPFCGYNAKSLSPIGGNFEVLVAKQVIGAGLRNGGCYKCGSTDRERLVYIYLKDVANILEKKDIKVLHLPPEKT